MFVYQSKTFLVVLCALLFGGVARVVPTIPLAAFVATVLVLAWRFGEGNSPEEPDWINRLSLASTGMLYLGLGHCLGLIALGALPLAINLAKR